MALRIRAIRETRMTQCKIEFTVPATVSVGQTITGTVTAIAAGPEQPPVEPPVTPPPPTSGGQPPGTQLLPGGPLMPNTGNRQVTMQVDVQYAIQMGADARDAGFSCPGGTCTVIPQNSVTPAQGMDTAVAFGALKAGDWLVLYTGPNHSGNTDALVSAHV